ncbi:hypothetical protein GQX73_g873 [Xylaria multiplex]|uniref:DUF7735 domain-containing protein n=1 Tax=Xylaria multiplex TaxID=323545 RepID=A0A7C8J333_9PEZI|nr:hypothetical protein GQX73_g873 [Xylaria multiplex]
MSSILLLFALAAAATSDMIAMPRQAITSSDTVPAPTSAPTGDPWQCATQNLTRFFDVPKPTGAALTDAIDSYVDGLLAPCMASATELSQVLSCSISNQAQWCGFATAAPPSVVTAAYSEYASTAASWWHAHSSAAVSLSEECPVSWARFGPIDHAWLNQTIAQAGCYNAAHGGDRGNLTTTNSKSTSSISSTPTRTATVGAGPTNNVIGRAGGVDMWMLASTGIGAAAVNTMS